jgi:ribosomal-protein-alanine N-acetyltransferase
MIAVLDKDEDLVGDARLATGEYESATLGSALRPGQWGQGKGLETIRLLQRLGFTELRPAQDQRCAQPAQRGIRPDHAAAGMTGEGTIRGHLYMRGAWRGSVVHSILSEEHDGQP